VSALTSFWRGFLFATLHETRSRLRTWWGRSLVLAITVVYAFVSMVLGDMLVFVSTPDTNVTTVSVVYGYGTQWWDYPALFVNAPWGFLTLPFFPTVAMLLVSIGVGIGGATGLVLALPLLRRAKGVNRQALASGSAASVGPAITGLATLGACCCTSCAGLVGVSVVAAASGSSLYNLLLNNWYIGVFQLGVVYIALLAQERSLRLTAEYCPVPPPFDRRFAAGALLRLGLLVSGITWSLAMFVEWTNTPPATANAAIWYHWIFEHQLLAITAIGAGLFPKEFAGAVRRLFSQLGGRIWRIALGVAGFTWGVWVPPTLAALGLGGFLNELFGVFGLPTWIGAVPPDSSLGLALYFHWAFQHLLLSGFALAVALVPTAATVPLLWTVSPERPAQTGKLPQTAPPSPERLPAPGTTMAPQNVEVVGPP
jgi:hypothetical protein